MDSWPMIEASWRAQWRGFNPDEQAYMAQESDRGRPTFIALGHTQHPLWFVERHGPYSRYPLPQRPGDHLICIKIDAWPNQFELDKSG